MRMTAAEEVQCGRRTAVTRGARRKTARAETREREEMKDREGEMTELAGTMGLEEEDLDQKNVSTHFITQNDIVKNKEHFYTIPN